MNLKLILVSAVAIIAITLFVLVVTWQDNDLAKNMTNTHVRYVKEYSLQEGSRPNALLVDAHGIVWITTSDSKRLLSLDPKSGNITNFGIRDNSLPEAVHGNSTMVWTMVQDHDGKIWFAGLGTKSIWQLEPKNDTFHLFHSESGAPFQMKVSHDGEIWFTTLRGDTIGVLEKSIDGNYKISSFETGNNTTPAGIFLQNDSIWTANIASQKISQYHVTRENNFVRNITTLQNIPMYNDTMFSSPTDLIVNNNSVWLTEHGTSFLTRYDLDTGKLVRYPTSQNLFHTTTLPFWIHATENPKILWFNEHQGNKIGCFDLENNTLTEYFIPSVPTDGYITYPLNISQDPRDEKILWFSEWNTDKVAVINGHIQIPFEITSSKKEITLSSNKTDDTVNLEIQGGLHSPNSVFLNASSSITPTAELGNLTVEFASNVVDLSHDQQVLASIHDGGVSSGNYTVGISASDGYVIKTVFLNLTILKK
ncbi:Vgb family protein [Candidatus Nitrosotalea bavarica]|uniref:Vgb family protein n=1 Tax=Candidatus Nitrosotalea bavarica TaxID=1903277 RepID=UPI000C713AB8|nr:two-component regulator propeller domain-containing protein [Candidatus Nitrosotalea bavarica]